MSAVVNYEKAMLDQPLGVREKFLGDPNRWRLVVDGVEYPPGTDFSFTSPPFGAVQSVVVLKPDGTPAFDRPIYTEAPHVHVVVWGEGADGRFYYGMVEQDRPHADQPGADNYGKDGHGPVRFLHLIMGFTEKAATGRFETPEAASLREAAQEGGTGSAVIAIEKYEPGHIASPSFTSTWGGVTAIQVDLEKLQTPIPDPNEPINGVFFIEGHDLLRIIKNGQNETGAFTGVCTSNSALLLHWANHPEQFPV